jgi:hypothetical protein
MKNRYLFPALFLFLSACKSDKKSDSDKIAPALSYIKSQIAHIDTSLFSIIKIDIKDSAHSDTTYIRREDFRALAKDFLELPDITDKKLSGLFKEESFYDTALNIVILTTRPVDASKTDIQRQEMVITPDSEGGKMKSIIIEQGWINRDSSVQKNLLWQTDKSFQVVTTKQKAGEPERTATLKVVWSDPTKE